MVRRAPSRADLGHHVVPHLLYSGIRAARKERCTEDSGTKDHQMTAPVIREDRIKKRFVSIAVNLA
jgi:hypothetical protein